MTDLSYIQYCADTQELINQLQTSVDNLMRPKADDSHLPRLHAMLVERLKDKDKGTAIRAELFVLLALYSPNRLYLKGGRTRDGRDQTPISKLMGLSTMATSRYKRNLLAHYKIYKSFRELVQECYAMCLSYIMAEKICENATSENQ